MVMRVRKKKNLWLHLDTSAMGVEEYQHFNHFVDFYTIDKIQGPPSYFHKDCTPNLTLGTQISPSPGSRFHW